MTRKQTEPKALDWIAEYCANATDDDFEDVDEGAWTIEDAKRFRQQLTAAEAARKGSIEQIAKDVLGLETLDERKSDSLDFSEHAVWTIKKALEEAYEAGRRAR